MNQKYHSPWLWIIPILLVVAGPLFPMSVSADTKSAQLPETFRFAKHLYDAGQFRQAAEAFEKFAFETPDSLQVTQALYLAARSYQKIGDTTAAQNACERALALNPDDLTDQLYLLKSELFKSINAIDEARITLHNLLAITKEPLIRDNAFYRLAWFDIEAGRFSEAEEWLKKITGANEYPVSELLQQLGQASTLSIKNPQLAGLLSIFPGGGQLYTGRYQDAAVALILNGLFFWGSIEAFDEDNTALGLLLGGIGLNFYVGNIYSAINSAHKHNRHFRNRFVEQLKTTFIQTGISHRNEARQLSVSLNLPF